MVGIGEGRRVGLDVGEREGWIVGEAVGGIVAKGGKETVVGGSIGAKVGNSVGGATTTGAFVGASVMLPPACRNNWAHMSASLSLVVSTNELVSSFPLLVLRTKSLRPFEYSAVKRRRNRGVLSVISSLAALPMEQQQLTTAKPTKIQSIEDTILVEKLYMMMIFSS